MAKSEVIKLAGEDYTVLALDLEELEQVTEWFTQTTRPDGTTDEKANAKLVFNILRLGLKSATPKVEFKDIRGATPEEVRAAVTAIMKLSGLSMINPLAATAVAGPGVV